MKLNGEWQRYLRAVAECRRRFHELARMEAEAAAIDFLGGSLRNDGEHQSQGHVCDDLARALRKSNAAAKGEIPGEICRAASEWNAAVRAKYGDKSHVQWRLRDGAVIDCIVEGEIYHGDETSAPAPVRARGIIGKV